MLSYLDEKAYLLLDIDEAKALELLAGHLDALPPGERETPEPLQWPASRNYCALLCQHHETALLIRARITKPVRSFVPAS